MLDPVRLTIHNLLDILMCKKFEHQRDVVRIQKELREILKLEDI